MMHVATLRIPPSCASAMQLLPHDVRETSNIANVRISVKQTIGRLKGFLLKNELLFPCFPQLIILFVFAVLCVIFFHHSVFNTLLTNMPSQVQNTVQRLDRFLLGFFYAFLSPDDIQQRSKTNLNPLASAQQYPSSCTKDQNHHSSRVRQE